MEKYFVTYQQALTLKELGFNEPCLKMSEHKKICEEHVKPGGCQLHNLHCGYPDCITDKSITPLPLPLKVQVFEWFENEHGLEGFVKKADDHNWYQFNCYHLNENGKSYAADMVEFKSRDEAEEKCIDLLIYFVKSNKKWK